ncbi:cupin-like domain-containing protein [Trinickia fusca]|nr:cupin-like domain-containing protein [Trinickia fusca]
MELAYEVAQPVDERVNAALERFGTRAAECHVPRSQAARVRVAVYGRRCVTRTFEIGATFATVSDDGARPVEATVSMTAATLDAILAAPTTFDARIVEFGSRIAIAGDVQVAHHLLQLLKRPTPKTVARLERARAMAPAWLDEVPQTSTVDASAVLASLTASRPLCLRGVLEWPACRWSLDEFAAQHGDVALLGGADGKVLSLRTFIGALRSASREVADVPYTYGCLLPAALEPLFPFPMFAPAAFSAPQIWAGARREHALVTRLHCDVAASFLAQVHGRKKVRLFAPAERERLYPFEAFNVHQPCRVDAANPDLTRFPLFAQARYVDITIDAGDLLIVPPGWYHCVWAIDDVISVSRFLDEDIAPLHFAN